MSDALKLFPRVVSTKSISFNEILKILSNYITPGKKY